MKKILALVACLSLVASLAIGGSIAYLTDRDSAANVFNIGDVQIDLTEDNFENGSSLLPGVTINKNPVVKNIGENEAYIWMTVAYPQGFDVLTEGKIITFNDSFDPTYWDGQTIAVKEGKSIDETDDLFNIYTYIYKEKLPKGEETPALFTSVTLNEYVDITPEGDMNYVFNGKPDDLGWNVKEDGNLTVYISAYAIQAEGFEDAAHAYENYYKQWGVDGKGDEYAKPAEILPYEDVNYIIDGKIGTASSIGGTTVYRGVFSDGESDVTEVIVKEGITRLNNRALCKMPGLTKVTLPSSLTYIDEGVFQQSGFIEITIPENVTYIGKQAIAYCENLEKIVINAENVTFGDIMSRACPNLKEVWINSDSVTFESGGMYFTNKESGDASAITFYVKSEDVADKLLAAMASCDSYGLLIKNVDGTTVYHNTLE